MKIFFTNWIVSSNFAYSAAAKARPSGGKFDIKKTV